jgi:hypothetical protein
MSFSYTPSSVVLSTITLPNDGDNRTAASVNGPFQDLANAIKYLTDHRVILATAVDLPGGTVVGTDVAGTFTAPADCVAAIVEAWGAGGGGGRGGNNAFSFKSTTGGGGGGGAMRRTSVVTIVGGESYAYTIPASAAEEANGGSAILTRVSTSTQIFVARGGGRGNRGAAVERTEWYPSSSSANVLRDFYTATRGGLPTARTPIPGAATGAIERSGYYSNFRPPGLQEGGWGINKLLYNTAGDFVGSGGYGLEGFSGGALGIAGADYSTLYLGGGGGGGGGAGPGGNGANGGNGSAAADVVANLVPASNGSNAGNGTGAGGGGGGGVGESNATSSVAAGLGGTGGSGYMRVWLLRAA